MLTSLGNSFGNFLPNGTTNLGASDAYGNNLGLLPSANFTGVSSPVLFPNQSGMLPSGGGATFPSLLSGAGTTSDASLYGLQSSASVLPQAAPSDSFSSMMDQLNAILNQGKKAKKEDDSDGSCSDNDYDAKAGKRLAKCAKAVVDQRGSTTGQCAKGVRLALQKALGEKLDGADACEWADKLGQRSDFKKYKKSGKDLKDLPAGAIVVWGKTDDSPHGHISIADGNGNEISDHKSKQLTNLRGDSDCTVFIPV